MDKDTTAQMLYDLAEKTRPDAAFATRLERDVLARWNTRGMARNLQLERRQAMFKRFALAAMAVAVVLLGIWAWPLWPGNRDKLDLPLLPRLASASGGGEMVGDGLLSGAELLRGVELPAAPDRAPVYSVTMSIPDTPDAALGWASDFGLPDPQLYRDPREPEALVVMGSDGRTLTFRPPGPMGGVHYGNSVAVDVPGDAPSFEQAAEVAVAFLREHNLLPEHYRITLSEMYVSRPDALSMTLDVTVELAGYPLAGYAVVTQVTVNAAGEVQYAYFPLLAFERLYDYPVMSAQEAWEALLSGKAFRLETDQTPPPGVDIRHFRRSATAHTLGEAVTVRGWAQILAPEQPEQPVWAQVTTLEGTRYLLDGIPNADELTRLGYNDLRVDGVIAESLSHNTWRLLVRSWEVATDPPPSMQSLVGTLRREGDTAWLEEDNGARYPLPDPPAGLENGARIDVTFFNAPVPGELLDWFILTTPPTSELDVAALSGGVSTVSVVVQAVEPEDGKKPPTPEAPFTLGQTVELTGVVYATLYREGDREWIEADLFRIPGVEYVYPLTGTDALMADLAQLNRLHVRIHGKIIPATVEWTIIHGQAIEVTSFVQLWPEEQQYTFLGSVSPETLEGQEVAVFTECSSGQQYALGPDVASMYQEFAERIPWQGMQVRIRGAVHPFETVAGLPLLQIAGLNSGPEEKGLECAVPTPLDPGPEIVERNDDLERAMQTAFTVDRVELVYYYEPTYASSSPFPSTLVQPVWRFSGVSGDGLTRFTAYVQAVREDYVADAVTE